MSTGGSNTNGQSTPQTREELATYLQGVQSQHGTKNAVTPLAKTNTKYMMAKNCPTTSETPEAERTAVQGMYNLVHDNMETVTKDDFASHMKTQQLDRQYHQSVTSQPNHPYGPVTTGLTDYVPTWMRGTYSYLSSSVPQVMNRPTSSSDKPK